MADPPTSPPPLPTSRAFLTSLINALPASPTPQDPPLASTRPAESSATTPPVSEAAPAEAPRRANPLATADPNAKAALLTLHVLFPRELLPALDLLDRGFVTRLRMRGNQSSAEEIDQKEGVEPRGQSGQPGQEDERKEEVEVEGEGGEKIYYVRSARSVQTSWQKRRQRPGSAGGGAGGQGSEGGAAGGTGYEVRTLTWNCSCPAFAFAAFPPSVAVAQDEDMRDDGGGGGGAEDVEMMEDKWRFGGVTRGDDTPVCKHLLACVLAERWDMLRDHVQEKWVSKAEAAGWAAG